ncbi:glycosyltransferase family 4 protein [Neiella sp. HB171785]|uniref:Glycosyltransferase family 4 protein n=1 Tax=Neiella litorisoli TaxID=2771431 RepID=A0A8J6QKK1_9GAMM|nr:glycosyltransferase family 4 protein [Neiella litorisoli]
MKVLHIEAGRHLYGGAQQVYYIMRALDPTRVQSFLACPPGSDIEHAARDVATVLPIKMSGDLDIAMTGRLTRLIRQHNIDLVHVHSRRGADLFGLWAAKRAGVPAIVSRRVDNAEPGWFARWKYHNYSHVVTISEGIRQVLLSQGVRADHVTTIRSAVDTDKFQPVDDAGASLRRTFDIGNDQLVIGVIAQLIERKGHRILLQALPCILQQVPNLKVIFFGKGPEQQNLHELINQLNLTEHVTLAGFRTDMDALLPGLDLVVHPAFMEGLGVSLLQASCCAVPVVAGRAGGIPEAVRDDVNGTLVEPGDVDGLRDAILALLLDQPLRQRIGQQGRQLMLDEFSIQAMADANADLYERLLNNRL